MKNIASICVLIAFLTSCNVLNTGDGEITTDLKLESNEITNIQDIEGTFTIRNGTDEAKTYGFSSGCQYAFKVLKEGKEVFDSYKGMFCTMATTSLTIQKRESKVFSMRRHFDIELEPSRYTIKLYLIGYESEVSASREFVVVD